VGTAGCYRGSRRHGWRLAGRCGHRAAMAGTTGGSGDGKRSCTAAEMVDVAKRTLVVVQTEGRSLAVTEKGAVAQRQRRKEELREQVCVAGRLSFPHRAPLGFAVPPILRNFPTSQTRPAPTTPPWRRLARPPRLPGGTDSPGPATSWRRELPQLPRPVPVCDFPATRADVNARTLLQV